MDSEHNRDFRLSPCTTLVSSWLNLPFLNKDSYNLFVITLFTLPVIIFFKISNIKKLLCSVFAILNIFALYIYGNYEINKNKKDLQKANNKILVKIISPNFDLK